jgi:uncharacterized protein YxjI
LKHYEKNYWPAGIMSILAGVVFLIIWTIYFATQSSVQDETAFFMHYRDVDLGINELQVSQSDFEKRYAFQTLTKEFALGKNILRFKILDQTGKKVSHIKTKILITRPHTNMHNQNVEVQSHVAGIWMTRPFYIRNKGRWKVEYYIEIDQKKGFFSQEINTTM